MLSLAKLSLRRNIGVFIVVLAVLIGGTWAAVKMTTSYLLYENATSTARNWARYLAESVTDLEQIADGEQPSAASLAFFQGASKSGQVFRYKIFNPEGFSQLVADREKTALVDLSEFSPDAARSIQSGQPIVDARQGDAPGFPAYYAQAYVPVLSKGHPIAVVAAYVDQAEQQAQFHKAFLLAALSLCLLTALSFLIPAVAWYRRSKEKQQADRRIRFLAHHDALTGLANRASLVERLSGALAVLPPDGGCLAVHFIDLDRFKEVNDTLGHDGGDFLLKTIAERLSASVRLEDVVARLGGDEFVVVQVGIDGKQQAEDFVERLLSALCAPIKFKEHEIVATVSIGVALAPADGSTPERLLKSADLALYKSKADGRNRICFFLPEMDAALQERLEIERAIREAVQHERYELHFQPVYEVSGRNLMGFEALLRLPKADGTLIPPLVFIPVAEEMRLIGKIGAWVLRAACRAAKNWPDHLTVAVNLSPAQFEAGSVSQIVAEALAEAGIEARRLELEITENLLLRDNGPVMAELRALKAMGVAIVMDDFGTGYSSLSYLWKFPFNKIKIDRSFMQGFDGTGRDAETVVKTIIALGRELNMHVTVEGVETPEQVKFLDDADADQVQGFFFGKPLPESELAPALLEDFQKTRPAATPVIADEAKLRLVKRSGER